MTAYSIVLFVHIVGAMGMFAAFGLEWASLAFMASATTAEQAREWLGVRTWVMRLGPASLALILLSGLYMAATTWGWMGWIVGALAALVLIAILGGILTGVPTGAIFKSIARERGPLSPAFRQQLSDPRLWISVYTRTTIAVDIVFLMVVKPDLIGSLVTIGIAGLLGLALSVPMWRRSQPKGTAAQT